MERFIIRPDITLIDGIKVKKDTNLTYKGKDVSMEIKDLKLYINKTETTDKYTNKTEAVINLEEGEILRYEEDRGYFLPALELQSIEESIEDLTILKGVAK